MNNILDNIKKNTLFYNIKEDEIGMILSRLNYSIESFDKGEIIAQEDDKCNSIGLVLEGAVNIERIYPSGKAIVMKKMLPGDVFGEALIFSKTTTYPATVIAYSNCIIAYLNKVELLKLFSLDNRIFENFMMLLSDKILMLNNKIKSISLKTVKQKVVDYILEEYNLQKNLNISLKLSKEEIAELIGIPRPSLSRALMNLREENLIEFDRNKITIIDIERLENILFQ